MNKRTVTTFIFFRITLIIPVYAAIERSNAQKFTVKINMEYVNIDPEKPNHKFPNPSTVSENGNMDCNIFGMFVLVRTEILLIIYPILINRPPRIIEKITKRDEMISLF